MAEAELLSAVMQDPQKITILLAAVEQEVRALAMGVNVAGLRQLGVLLPEPGWNRERNALGMKWDSEFCHEGNWTDENLWWAIEFITDMAVKAGARSAIPRLLTENEYFDYKISPKGEEALIFAETVQSVKSVPFNPRTGETFDPTWQAIAPDQEPILKLRKGEEIIGTVKPYWDKSWVLVESSHLQNGKGYVAQNAVTITRVPRKP